MDKRQAKRDAWWVVYRLLSEYRDNGQAWNDRDALVGCAAAYTDEDLERHSAAICEVIDFASRKGWRRSL